MRHERGLRIGAATAPAAAVLAATVLAAVALTLAGCAGPSGSSADSSSGEGREGAADAEQTVTVFAAASLQAAFDEAAEAFEAENPGVEVRSIVYDGSSTLATQIVEGAPVDVFASADERNMRRVVDEGLAVDPVPFATNTLVVAVPEGNPGNVAELADLADAVTVLCAPEVPCGAASEQLLANAGVEVAPASLEQNVTAVLEKVAAGEADAGLVYATDVLGDAAVESFVPEGADDVVNVYPVAALEGAAHPEAARDFVEFLLAPEGRAVLDAHGFGEA
ncbi:molybdate ABC transporter substrate-binding protein [Leucobacter sp. CSA1]|uniref:Molybdate ABC transporter substrate-binding protein n=1 Tax=Leucobacter chromiisoli TaxID=2796471 RepID=A0A934Q323_9MICO|nr:molybdate ABC transporter substrate-binding protein [Leucobacter chromiisoli]MBK0417615.1 molybdate ABC transporter substrate-binding protein [Leucobacter chromiisoli]